MKLINIYKEYLKLFQKNNISEMSLKLLLCDFYNIDSITSFILNFEDEYPELTKKQLKILNKVLNGYPVQYALNKADFYNQEFYVNKHTLIPRPETEELVFYTLKKIQEVFKPNEVLDYVDLGCGSGNILISIEKYAGFAMNSVTGVDISFLTLQATKKNKKYLGSAAILKKSDMIKYLKKTPQKFNILTSNPPYISKLHDVDESVKKYEPKRALYINPSYYYYEQIINLLPKVMKDKFVASFEIGYDLKEILESILKRTKFNTKIKYDFIKDMYGNDRVLIIYSE
jgi:release factor glutamine methyltransferase